MAAGVAGTGVGVAAAKKPPTFKACATKANVLTLANSKGRCAKGTHAVKLNAQGPAGPAGATGASGPKGATGATGTTGMSGAAGTANAAAGRVSQHPRLRRDVVQHPGRQARGQSATHRVPQPLGWIGSFHT